MCWCSRPCKSGTSGRLLWGGGLVSSVGSWLLVLAVPAHILAVTGSLRDTGLTFAAQYLPQLVLGPVAGAVADICDRRRLMIWTNLCCAGAVAVMLLGTAPGRYWVLYAALAAENAGPCSARLPGRPVCRRLSVPARCWPAPTR